MKFIAPVLAGFLFLAGCSRQAAAPVQGDDKFETLTLIWESDLPDAGLTNHCVIVRSISDSTTNVAKMEVHSLDQAATILGQYGWKLVSAETSGNVPAWHMSRHYRADGKTFDLILYNSEWDKATR